MKLGVEPIRVWQSLDLWLFAFWPELWLDQRLIIGILTRPKVGYLNLELSINLKKGFTNGSLQLSPNKSHLNRMRGVEWNNKGYPREASLQVASIAWRSELFLMLVLIPNQSLKCSDHSNSAHERWGSHRNVMLDFSMVFDVVNYRFLCAWGASPVDRFY